MGNGYDDSNISKIFGILRMINRSINYKRKEVTLTLYDTDLEDYPNLHTILGSDERFQL